MFIYVSGSSGGGWTRRAGSDVYLTTSTDNVGIGTSGPDRKVDIGGTGSIVLSVEYIR